MRYPLASPTKTKPTTRWTHDYFGRVVRAFRYVVRLDRASRDELSTLLFNRDIKRVGKFRLQQVKGRVYIEALSGPVSSFGPVQCVHDAVRIYHTIRTGGMFAATGVVLLVSSMAIGWMFNGVKQLETQNSVSSPEIAGRKPPIPISRNDEAEKAAQETFPRPETGIPFHGSAHNLFAAFAESSRQSPRQVRFIGSDQVHVGDGLAIDLSGETDLGPILAKLNPAQNSAVLTSVEEWTRFGANLRRIAVFGQRVVLWPTNPHLLDGLALAPTGQKVNTFTVSGWQVVIYDERVEIVEWSAP